MNKLIDKQIRMLPIDVQEVVNKPRYNTIQKETQETNDTDERRKKLNQELRNWTPTTVQERKDNISNRVIEDQRRSNNSKEI